MCVVVLIVMSYYYIGQLQALVIVIGLLGDGKKSSFILKTKSILILSVCKANVLDGDKI
jgi:hypothetical protein